jgi:hypothetical protein
VQTVTAELVAAADAPALRRHFLRIGFVILPPPLNPAGITAKPPMLTLTPFRLKIFAAVRADLHGSFLCHPFFLPPFSVVYLAASIAAESPIPPSFAALLNVLATLRAGIHRH